MIKKIYVKLKKEKVNSNRRFLAEYFSKDNNKLLINKVCCILFNGKNKKEQNLTKKNLAVLSVTWNHDDSKKEEGVI